MEAEQILACIRAIGRLKNLPRTGWRLRGIRDCESVADHAYGTAALAMLLADALAGRGLGLDMTKVLRMALLHDLGEALIGDIPQGPSFPEAGQLKRAAEAAAVERLTRSLGAAGRAYHRLWQEWEEGSSREARLVQAADKLEMLVQALEYERAGSRSLAEFWTHAGNRRHFEEFPVVAEIAALLVAERGGASEV